MSDPTHATVIAEGLLSQAKEMKSTATVVGVMLPDGSWHVGWEGHTVPLLGLVAALREDAEKRFGRTRTGTLNEPPA